MVIDDEKLLSYDHMAKPKFKINKVLLMCSVAALNSDLSTIGPSKVSNRPEAISFGQ